MIGPDASARVIAEEGVVLAYAIAKSLLHVVRWREQRGATLEVVEVAR
jgi:hypothetical protein